MYPEAPRHGGAGSYLEQRYPEPVPMRQPAAQYFEHGYVMISWWWWCWRGGSTIAIRMRYGIISVEHVIMCAVYPALSSNHTMPRAVFSRGMAGTGAQGNTPHASVIVRQSAPPLRLVSLDTSVEYPWGPNSNQVCGEPHVGTADGLSMDLDRTKAG